jgi:hypothetical protein
MKFAQRKNQPTKGIGNRIFQGIILLFILIIFVFFLSALANIIWKGLGGFVEGVASIENNEIWISSGRGVSPHRWYSPRAARHDSVKFRGRQ